MKQFVHLRLVHLVVVVFLMEIIAQNVQKEDAVVQHLDKIYDVSLIVNIFFEKILLDLICTKNSYLIIAVFFLFPILAFSLKHQLTGKTQDSLQNPVPNTNIIATALTQEDVNITFAISSLEGEYKLKLENNIPYQIAITHLGYKKITDTATLTSDKLKNHTLQEGTETLEEVLIKAEMAVIVKEDTITHRTDQFKTGEERRLTQTQKNTRQPHKLLNI